METLIAILLYLGIFNAADTATLSYEDAKTIVLENKSMIMNSDYDDKEHVQWEEYED